MTEQLEASVLGTLHSKDSFSTLEFAKLHNIDHQVVVGVCKSLNVEFYVQMSQISSTSLVLTDEGSKYVEQGTPEYQLFNSIPFGRSIAQNEVPLPPETVKLGMGPCMKLGWLRREGQLLSRAVENIDDVTGHQLRIVRDGDFSSLTEEDLKNLKKRNLITQVKITDFTVVRGPNYAPERKKKAADLTKKMLETKEYEVIEFKPYNFNSIGNPVGGGFLHPLLKVRTEFRKILMNMGFEEMPTNRWVESSFWNFDALFQPQSHPARDAHDTFFISHPSTTRYIPEDYYEIVKTQHEQGGFGSIGYGCQFSREEASKNLLRTHTTAISAQMLYRLANQPEGFEPKKYFSIDRVFRNETMDATHLCEFHQIEGLVADRNLSLGHLKGIIRAFFKQIGITQLRFKPAYNPYTEPSMEIFGFHPDLNRWTEIGNSGIFRPEMLRPMGLPEDVRVIAWGLSLERPTMIKYRIKNIRDLFGHKADFNLTKTCPICQFP